LAIAVTAGPNPQLFAAALHEKMSNEFLFSEFFCLKETDESYPDVTAKFVRS